MSTPPDGIHLEHLQQASMAIATSDSHEGFDIMGLYGIADKNQKVEPVALMTNVYRVPGELSPSLRKVHLTSPDISAWAASSLNEMVTAALKSRLQGYGYEAVRQKAQNVAAACEATEQSGSSLIIPFETVALLAVYNTVPAPTVRAFASRQLVDELDKLEDEELLPVAELSEDAYRDVYSLQSEQGATTETYEVWKDRISKELSDFDPDAKRRGLAMIAAVMLLLPEEDTHPVINSILF